MATKPFRNHFNTIMAHYLENVGKRTIDGAEEEGYIVRPVSVGNVSITFLPMDIR